MKSEPAKMTLEEAERAANELIAAQSKRTKRKAAKAHEKTDTDKANEVDKVDKSGAARSTKSSKSSKPAGHSGGHFDIRRMGMGTRYVYLGAAIIILVLSCFFIGLAIDFLLEQPATCAQWGIGIGSVLALLFCYSQLRKLVK